MTRRDLILALPCRLKRFCVFWCRCESRCVQPINRSNERRRLMMVLSKGGDVQKQVADEISDATTTTTTSGRRALDGIDERKNRAARAAAYWIEGLVVVMLFAYHNRQSHAAMSSAIVVVHLRQHNCRRRHVRPYERRVPTIDCLLDRQRFLNGQSRRRRGDDCAIESCAHACYTRQPPPPRPPRPERPQQPSQTHERVPKSSSPLVDCDQLDWTRAATLFEPDGDRDDARDVGGGRGRVTSNLTIARQGSCLC